MARGCGRSKSVCGAIDILVNNAGISGIGASEQMLDTEWDRLMEVNARGAFLGIRHVAPGMQKRRRGAVVNIGSIAAFRGQAGLHPGYGASKAAIVGLTRSAALRYALDGIRVNAVHPGFMPPMRTARAADPSWRSGMVARVPMGREGRVDEVAAAVLFLASDEFLLHYRRRPRGRRRAVGVLMAANADGRLSGKVAIVTGGGSGIGAAIVRRFRREAARVVVADIDLPAAEAIAAEPGAEAIAVAHDVRDEAAWHELIARCEAQFGGLHVLVNNAGIVGPDGQDPERLTLDVWQAVAAVDAEGVSSAARPRSRPSLGRRGCYRQHFIDRSATADTRVGCLWCRQGGGTAAHAVGGAVLRT